MRISSGLISISMSSLISGITSQDTKEVCLLPAALKGEITGIPMKLENTPDISLEDIEQGIGEKSPYSILVDKIQEIIDKNALTDSVKVREEDSGVVLQLSENVLFDLGKADLKPESIKVLDIISTLIPSISNEIMVQGHTDNIPISSGTYKLNWELSTARAITVLRYFIETKGFDPTRFSATGYGEYKPLVDNSTEENRAINRRVDILIVQQKEK